MKHPQVPPQSPTLKDIRFKHPGAVLLFLCLLAIPAAALAGDMLDCAKKSLGDAIAAGKSGTTIAFTGICGPIAIGTDGLKVTGVGTAIIDGGGKDAVTVSGVSGVTLTNIEVRNGLNGILARDGAHLTLSGVNSHDNAASGISLRNASSGALSNVTSTHNGVTGLDLATGAAAVVTGDLTVSGNTAFGIDASGSSITFSQANVAATGNGFGVQIANGSSASINGPGTVLNANDNLADGLSIGSGAHMVSRGGTINATGNGLAGVLLSSKAGLDLDAAAILNSFGNGDGLVAQGASVVTVVNIPQFSGAAGFSTINCHDNTEDGVNLQTGSTLTLSNSARLISTQNGRAGVGADNGADVTLVSSTLTGNTVKDVQFTFGTRADLQTTTLGTYTCDATVLARGTAGITCPH